ncbi:MFS transporter [Zymomonas mobilis]|uniref:Major facilitator superfamily MFS_1 n=1 Tax=Zymomonas mobilis subsp. pomaceae (strain ATCC 29192 / DSM 22645 / JCM 10191 / CCUG 17912 / NBRC 13757 / NCIMB 11200 / NRRL B-4491 / Barker I) TaxID=579138 RepID=F8EUA9_ZYMMT|nr:MFS transporter [Zymomonas mobilis]AEI38130.1 major facilitator superfamily MFS_1 [Zymomonas mobilis subsp. pomaceae ATCC 29192]MDX5949497.1 MFS transporter [Zymomonas mobilis subsp. pomaceae]GEB89240.1 MFS transporter [Zymomonas mobilis subsp. pomaceae]
MTDTTLALSPARMMLFSATTGIMVANLYYIQPLLAEVSASFHHTITEAGYLVTCTQLGYALGVLFIVPLGDSLDQKKMITMMLACNIVSLLIAAFSTQFFLFAFASLMMGITSSAAQVVVPYVAARAPDAIRGRLVGQVMTGLLLGILLARTVSGVLSAWAGWRWIYILAAITVTFLMVALRLTMLADEPQKSMPYRVLLGSLVDLLKEEPELRLRAWYGLLGLGSFSMLWTGLTFLLSAAPYHFSAETIGLFGLIGAAGALSANLAGRICDRGYAQLMTISLSAILLAAWCIMSFGQYSLFAVYIGIFFVDVGAQGLQVTNQTVIYKLAPQARSRITAIFITAGFIGMSLGSALASYFYDTKGWVGLCMVGAALPIFLIISWGSHQLYRSKNRMIIKP